MDPLSLTLLVIWGSTAAVGLFLSFWSERSWPVKRRWKERAEIISGWLVWPLVIVFALAYVVGRFLLGGR